MNWGDTPTQKPQSLLRPSDWHPSDRATAPTLQPLSAAMAINPLAAVGSLATAVESMRGGHVGYMEHVPATIGTGELTRRFSSSTSLTSMRAKSVPEDLASILEVRCSTTRLVGVFWSVLGRWFQRSDWGAVCVGCVGRLTMWGTGTWVRV